MNLLPFGKFFEKNVDSGNFVNNKTFGVTRSTCDWLTNKIALLATAVGGAVMVVIAGCSFLAPKDNNNNQGHWNNQRPNFRDNRR